MTDTIKPNHMIVDHAVEAAIEVQEALTRIQTIKEMPADQANHLIATAEARVIEQVVADRHSKRVFV